MSGKEKSGGSELEKRLLLLGLTVAGESLLVRLRLTLGRMEIKPYFTPGYMPVVTPSPASPALSPVYLVRFVDMVERIEKPGCTVALPSYGLLFEKYHQIAYLSMVMGEVDPYGVVWEWTQDCTKHYKTHYFGWTSLRVHELQNKLNSVLTLFGSYHKIWWHADAVVYTVVKATTIAPDDAKKDWPDASQKVNLDMPDDLVAIQRYDEDGYKPSNPKETTVSWEYCNTSRHYIILDADRRLPRRRGCCIL